VRQGQGTSVRPIEDWNLLDPVLLAATVRHDAELSILSELVDVRAALEGKMAGSTALRATDETRSHLTSLVDILHRATESQELFLVTDVAFHKAIMVSSGNRLAQAVIRNLTDEANRSPRYVGESTVEDLLVSNEGHDEILAAILRGDADRANSAMARHITLSWERRRPSGVAREARESRRTGARRAAH
jgi:GntR family galactonate operon transcriptional repressor